MKDSPFITIKSHVLCVAAWQLLLVRRLVEFCIQWKKPPVSGVGRFAFLKMHISVTFILFTYSFQKIPERC